MTDEEDALADARVMLDLSLEVAWAIDRVRGDLKTPAARSALDGFRLMSDFLGNGAEAILKRFGEPP